MLIEKMTDELAEACTISGATFLDGYRPGWAVLVNEATLDTASPSRCVLGQTGGFGDGIHAWTLKHGLTNYRNGFQNPTLALDAFRYLDAAWKRRIAERRAG